MAMAAASTTAIMAMISNMAGSVSLNGQRGRSAPERYQCAHVRVAQPEPAPYYQPKIEPVQRVGKERTGDPPMRCHRGAEIAGQQDRAENRGGRDRVENGAHDGDDA